MHLFVHNEKAQVQALDRTAPILPMLLRTPGWCTHDHMRHGTTGLFGMFDLATGPVISSMCHRHRRTRCPPSSGECDLSSRILPAQGGLLGVKPRFTSRRREKRRLRIPSGHYRGKGCR
jgi:hypothetical protein